MPKISVNKLGEFLVTSNPLRRRRILNDQKYPSNTIVPLYRSAMPPLAAYLQNNGQCPEPILTAIDRLRSDESGSPWALQDRLNTAEALEQVLLVAKSLPLEQPTYQYRTAPTNPRNLSFSGVDVSVRPNFLLHASKRGKSFCGAIKFHFIKTQENSLNEAGAQYVASLLYHWLQNNAPAGRTPRPDLCLSIDVFRGAIVPAPQAVSRRLSEIDAACQEIANRWHSL